MSALIDNLNARQVGKDQSKVPDQAARWGGSYAASYLQQATNFEHMNGGSGRPGRTQSAAPRDASDCNTTACLDAWRSAQLSQIDNFVPKQYQHPVNARIDKIYSKNLDRLKNSTVSSSSATDAAQRDTVQRSHLTQAAADSEDTVAKATAAPPMAKAKAPASSWPVVELA